MLNSIFVPSSYSPCEGSRNIFGAFLIMVIFLKLEDLDLRSFTLEEEYLDGHDCPRVT